MAGFFDLGNDFGRSFNPKALYSQFKQDILDQRQAAKEIKAEEAAAAAKKSAAAATITKGTATMSLIPPNIFDINQASQSNAMSQDTTLNTDNTDSSDDGGTNINDVLSSLISIAPSLLILSRTPTQQLPKVTGNSTQPILKPATTVTSDIMIIIIVLIIAVVMVLVLKKR